jgi:hypothetical protein
MAYAVWALLGCHHHDGLRERPASAGPGWTALLTVAILILMLGLGYLLCGVP